MTVHQSRIEILEAPDLLGLSVTEVCRRHGISRQTFYAWRRRAEGDGVAAREPRPRRPSPVPGRTPVLIEHHVVLLRRANPRWGARRLRAQLVEHGVVEPPALSTLHAILHRNGLLAAPSTRPGPTQPTPVRPAPTQPTPAGPDSTQPTRTLHPNRNGVVTYRSRKIGLGSAYAGRPIDAVEHQGMVQLFAGEQLVRAVTLGAAGTYHGSGGPRGRPPGAAPAKSGQIPAKSGQIPARVRSN